ncbi:trimeric intracellular cation channel family protein [Deinococcus lacus]|uniref:Trimeric intracellular cation channel family protein n=1 Tax=Deinococcus lacus TaxID=392561 RepID=A0ABW1YC69_9DEIO
MPELSLPDIPLEQLQTGLRALDLLGILAFSMSGALLAVRKRFDLFGVLTLGSVTAMGGGAVRDALTGQMPPLFLREEIYVWVAFLGAALAFALGERTARFERTLSLFDSLGLAIFASSGALGAAALGYGPLGVTFAGLMSGVGGGIIRDLIANEVPEVMYRRDQLYGTAAAAGGAAVYLLYSHLSPAQTQVAATLVVLAVRIISRQGWVKLPVRRLPGG